MSTPIPPAVNYFVMREVDATTGNDQSSGLGPLTPFDP